MNSNGKCDSNKVRFAVVAIAMNDCIIGLRGVIANFNVNSVVILKLFRVYLTLDLTWQMRQKKVILETNCMNVVNTMNNWELNRDNISLTNYNFLQKFG